MNKNGPKGSLTRAATLQIVALTIFASVLVFAGAESLRTSMQAVEQADQVIGAGRELIKLNVDMETGLRGFLLTGQAMFLQPYEEADPVIDAKFELLSKLLADDPAQQARLADIWTSFKRWKLRTAALIGQGTGPSGLGSEPGLYDQMLARKVLMDKIRGQYEVLIATEVTMRNQRSQRVRSRYALLSYSCFVFAVLGGAGLWWILRRQVRQLSAAMQKSVDAERIADALAIKIAQREKDDAVANYRGEIEAIDRAQIRIELSMDGTILKVNENHVRAFGYQAAELEGKDFSLLVPYEERKTGAYREFWNALKNGRVQTGRFERISRDGTAKWIHAHYNPIFDADGVLVKIVGLLTDVTEKVRVERELKHTESRLQVILDAIEMAVLMTDPTGNIVSANHAAARMFRYGLDQIIGNRVHVLTPEPQRGLTRDGSIFPIEVTITEALHDGERRLIWLIRDITDRNRAETERRLQEEGLRKSQAFLEQTGSLAGVGGWELDLLTNKVTWAAETCRILGATPGHEPTLEEALDLYTPESRPVILAAIEKATTGGSGWDLELSLIGLDGRRLSARVVGEVELAGGKPVRLTGAFQDITARVAERRALEDANTRVALATSSSGIGIWDWDLQNDVFDCDSGIYRLYGLDPYEGGLHGLEFWAGRVHPDDRPACKQALLDAIEERKPYDTEFRIVWADGSVHHIKAAGQVSRDPGGKPLRMVGTNFDITQRRLQLKELRKSEDFLERTGRMAGIGGWEYDLATDALYWSRETYRIYGVGPDFQPDFKTGSQFFAPMDRPAIQAAVEECISVGTGWDLDVGLNRADGKLVTVRLVGSAELVDGQPVRLVGTIQDITSRIAEKLALRDANTRVALATESGGIGLWNWDLQTNKIICDARMYRLCNLDPDANASNEAEFWGRFVHPEDQAPVQRALLNGMEGLAPYDTEYRILWDDGSLHWIKASGQVTRNEAGKAVRMVGTNLDITARVAERQALEDANRRVALATDSGGIGIWDWHIPSNVFTCDRWMYRLYGLEPDTGSRFDLEFWARHVHPEDRPGSDQALQDCIDGIRPFDAEFRIFWDDGSVHHIKASGQVTRDDEGRPIRVVGTNFDITQRKQAEEELRESQSFLEQTGRLAGVGGWEIDLATTKITWAPETCRILGAPSGFQPTLTESLARYADQARPLIKAALERAKTYGEGWDLELSLSGVDGRQLWARMIGTVESAQGKPVRLKGAFQDITVRVAERLALLEAKSRIALATESGHIGIFDRDYKSNKLTCDPWMHRLYGLDPDGSQVFDHAFWVQHVHPDDRLTIDEALRIAADGIEPYNAAFRIVWDDGSVHHIKATGQVSCDADGKALRMVGTNMDVTEWKLSQEAAEEARLQAELANGAKSDFLANMSHEVRTPVNAILGMAHLALRADQSPQQRVYLAKIDKAARSLLGIMNDILDFSKMEAGKLTVEHIDFSLDEVLKNVLDIVDHRAKRKGLPIVFSIAPGVPRHLLGDPLRLGQVLINLVNNAVKFADQGKIVVKVASLDGSEGAHLKFSVADSGIGMTPEQLANIFQSFNQADTSFTRKYGGTGLGLAISKQLCELMGGTISVESEIGVGSTFSFTVTFDIPAQGVMLPTRIRPSGLERRNILVVDDSESTRETLVALLNARDYTARCVSSGEEAISALVAAEESGDPFAMVLMDWRLPGINGIETSRRIKAHRSLAQTPAILIVSGFERDEVMCEADDVVLDGYLIKPVDQSQLFRVMDSILELSPDEGAPRVSALPEEVAKLKGRRVLLVEDNQMNLEVATELLDDLGIVATVAKNGREGLDMVAAQPFDLVLMDIQMPLMDGLTATRLIRSDARFDTLPVLAMTAHAMSGDHQRSLDAGMSDHITKPISFDELTKALLKWMPMEPSLPLER